ncbi:hypothetical protein Tco_1025087 [Tanacetum coccineum]
MFISSLDPLQSTSSGKYDMSQSVPDRWEFRDFSNTWPLSVANTNNEHCILFIARNALELLMEADMVKAQARINSKSDWLNFNYLVISPRIEESDMVHQRYIDKDSCVSESSELFALACGPTPSPISVNSCVVNGVRQSMDVDAPPDIINVDDDLIDDEEVLPHDLASDDEDLANDDDDDVAMSADVARGHGGDGGGDDRPLYTYWLPREPENPTGEAEKPADSIPAGKLGTSAHRSNLLGEIVREFPMHYPFWHKIVPERKAGVIGNIRSQFDLTPYMQSPIWPNIHKGIEQQLAKMYTDNNSALKHEHSVLKPDGTPDEEGIRSRRPANITPAD